MIVDTVAEAKAQLDALKEKVRTGEKLLLKQTESPLQFFRPMIRQKVPVNQVPCVDKFILKKALMSYPLISPKPLE